MLDIVGPVADLTSRTTLKQFFSLVNWRNSLAPPALQPLPHSIVTQVGLMKLATFWQATNWRNVVNFNSSVMAVEEVASQEFQLNSMMSQFEWD